MVIVPPGEMAAQLDRVVELAGRHRITPQIVPRKCGAYPLMAASIKVMTFPDAPPLLYIEAACSGGSSTIRPPATATAPFSSSPPAHGRPSSPR
ncbi:DUF5753 domain-containing protein [Streptomyces sp. NBC_01723]|uniref:Scr1 family TA system antitoxin-like transcriptional regulator n=1 Tax=Streptomyces sp. NBC_01723 TaxID=2975921 RepID=UPI002E33ADC8|nr:Scr1 family TA system antitoxin-like transcriptional regulator [Streptomyces sp. NBC_01723]